MCDKTCIFCFFPIINKYLCMAKRSLLSRCPSYIVYLVGMYIYWKKMVTGPSNVKFVILYIIADDQETENLALTGPGLDDGSSSFISLLVQRSVSVPHTCGIVVVSGQTRVLPKTDQRSPYCILAASKATIVLVLTSVKH